MPSGYSVLEYQGDGVTDTFAVNFALGYLNKSDIYCRVGDEVDGSGNPAYRELESIPGDPGRMRVLGAIPTASQKVLFRRVTPKTALENDYADGESLDDDALDNSFKQGLMIAHELLDGFGLSTVYSDIDLTGHKIVNVETDPDDPTSLCNVAYAGQAPVHSAAAAESATAAAASAASAATANTSALAAQVAAEAAAASVPDAGDILTKHGNLAGLTNTETARANLALGTAAQLDVGSSAGNLVQVLEGGKLPALNAENLTNLPSTGNDLAVRNAVRLAIMGTDAACAIPGGWLDVFAADTLATKTGATYNSSNDLYSNTVTASADIVPALSGYTGGGYTVSVSSNYDAARPGWKLFDNGGAQAANSAGVWSATTNSGTVKVECSAATPIGGYAITGLTDTATYHPKTWTFEGSSTGSFTGEQTTIDTQTNQSIALSERKVYPVTANFKYYRLNVSAANGGAYLIFSELELLSVAEVANMTLVTAAFATGANVDSVEAHVCHKAIDAVTPGTDIKVRASANGGTNWSDYGTLESLGETVLGFSQYKATFTGLTAGTAPKVEITTYNSKVQQVRAIAQLVR